jgi:hypothetical protein
MMRECILREPDWFVKNTRMMKNRLIRVCMGFLAALLLSSLVAQAAPNSAEQLRDAYEAAVKAGNKEAILALIHWEGVSDRMKAFEGDLTEKMFKNGVKSVKLGAVPPASQTTFTSRGVRRSPNLPVLGSLEVEFVQQGDTKITRKLPYGKKGDVFYLTGTLEEKVPAPPDAR